MNRLEIAVKIITSDVFSQFQDIERVVKSFELTDKIIEYNFNNPVKIDKTVDGENFDIEICEVICQYFRVSRLDLNLPIKPENIAFARQFCWYWLHFYFPKYSLRYLSQYFKRKNHNGSLYGIKKVADMIKHDRKYKDAYNFFVDRFKPDMNDLTIYNEHNRKILN